MEGEEKEKVVDERKGKGIFCEKSYDDGLMCVCYESIEDMIIQMLKGKLVTKTVLPMKVFWSDLFRKKRWNRRETEEEEN